MSILISRCSFSVKIKYTIIPVKVSNLLPAGHKEHSVTFPREKDPAAQFVHCVAPVSLLYCPAGQPSHVFEPERERGQSREREGGKSWSVGDA